MDGRRRPHWAEAAFQAYRPGKVHVTSGGFVEAYEGLIAVGEDGWLDYASETWTGPDGKDGSDTILTRFPRERVGWWSGWTIRWSPSGRRRGAAPTRRG